MARTGNGWPVVCIGIVLTVISGLVLVKSKGAAGQPPAAATRPAPTPATQPDSRCPLRLSEVKLDGYDGSDDWWVELYNTSNRDIDAAGFTVVINGKAISTIGLAKDGKATKPTKVPARGLLLIQVDIKDHSCATWTTTTRPKSRWTPTITVVPPHPQYLPGPQRKPGYCALFRSPKLSQETLVDYVRWGRIPRGKPRPKWPHSQWAAKRRLWGPNDAIPIGLNPRPGDFYAPPKGSSICRYQFSRRRIGNEMWGVCLPKYTTPKACNAVPPPIISWPFGGHAADGPLPVGCRWRSIPPVIPADNSAKKPYHFQIAVDAMFEEIVFDARYDGGAQSIRQGQLKPGRYWARVRYDSPKLSTSWSEARSFSYR